ncbi:hypothetical protein ACFPOB_27310 [Bosea eneae]|uniref:Uncharacterized protein n=1 Tax=Bosea eneae TaxID=151454 RepID=A0ABW0J196_9HYPH
MRDATIINIANPAFAAGRLAGIREAAGWLADAAKARYEMASKQTAFGGPRHADHAAALEQAAAAILALAEGKEG